MKRSCYVRPFKLLSLTLALMLMFAISASFAQSSAPSGGSKAPQAKADSAEKEARRALRQAQREAAQRERAQAYRAAPLAPELAAEALEESLRELSEAPWPEIHESMALAREAMHEAQAELHNLDFTELNESLAELAFTLPPHGVAPHGIPPIHIPPMPIMPPIPPIPAIAPLAAPPHIANCNPGHVWRGSFHSSKEYQAYLSEDERLRITALSALINQDENTAFAEIKNMLVKNPNWAMRAAAVEMLACFDSKESVTLLRDTLHNETDQRIRLAAVRGLSHHDDPEARAALQELLK